MRPADTDLVPARMLNEFTYCPRLAYLEWVQGEWADNPDTLDGEFVHRNADQPDHRPVGPVAADESFHTRSLRLESADLQLVAVVDTVDIRIQPFPNTLDARESASRGADFRDRPSLAKQWL